MDLIFELMAIWLHSSIGWLYLHLRYWSDEKRKAMLQEDYAGSYALAGSESLLMVITIVIALPFLGFIVIVLWGLAKKFL